ncbi:MAG: glycosyltransferase family 2 protein [Planctomycetaceae bacterium]
MTSFTEPRVHPLTAPTAAGNDRPGNASLSVVIPCHNEEAVISTTHRRLVGVLEAVGMAFEIVYVDDGSRDATLACLERIAAADGRAKVVQLARNFGQQAAMSAGLAEAAGDAVVLIDADLQDPPEVIPEMIALWRRGIDVAYGRRRSREGETRVKLVTAALFHRLLSRLVPHPIPVDTGDFKLLDRAVVDTVVALPERRRYLRSMVAWTGFRHEPVWYDRHARLAGATNYSLVKLAKLAADALVISSDAPLRLTWVGVASLLAVAAAAGAVAARTAGPGPSVAAILAVAAGVATVPTAATALVGEYVVRTYREAQHRPAWVVRRRIGRGLAVAGAPRARAA